MKEFKPNLPSTEFWVYFLNNLNVVEEQGRSPLRFVSVQTHILLPLQINFIHFAIGWHIANSSVCC